VRNDVHRMDYPTYQARGWAIGSGPVKAACKLVVGQRLKGRGMRWRQRQPVPPARPVPQPTRPVGGLLVRHRRLKPTNKKDAHPTDFAAARREHHAIAQSASAIDLSARRQKDVRYEGRSPRRLPVLFEVVGQPDSATPRSSEFLGFMAL
jgi:hypothetical protein